MGYDKKVMKSRRDYINKEVPEYAKKKIAGLLADNIIDHMDRKEKAEEAEAAFWDYSKVWRSIEDTLWYGDDNALITKRKPIRTYLGSIKLNSVTKRRTFEEEKSRFGDWTLVFNITVEYCDDDEDYGYGYGYGSVDGDGVTDDFYVYVPLEFATNWDEYKWDKWLEAETARRAAAAKEWELRRFEGTVRKMLEKYPNEVRRMLEK